MLLSRLTRRTAAVCALFALHLDVQGQGKDLTSQYEWKPVRIGSGGFVRGLAVHPSDPKVRIARADVDNFYRWDEEAHEWMPIKIDGAFPQPISSAPASGIEGAVALDPNDAKVVLIAYSFRRSADLASTNPSIALNVYRSEDGGHTFRASNLSLPHSLENERGGERLAIDPHNGKVVYFGTPGNGLWRSLDGGLHFDQITDAPTLTAASNVALPLFDAGCGTTRLDGLDVSRCVFLTLTGGPVLRSLDGGAHFSVASKGQPFDGSPGFAAVDRRGNLWLADPHSSDVYRMSRAGDWTTLHTPVDGVAGIAVDPTKPERLFITSEGGEIARSLDAGSTWTDLGEIAVSEKQAIQWLRPSPIRPKQHYMSAGGIYFDPSGRLWVPGGNDGVVSTMPDDARDTPTHPPLWASDLGIEQLVTTAAVIPPGQKPLLAVDDETLYRIEDPDAFSAEHFSLDLWAQVPRFGHENNGLSSAQDINYSPNQPGYVVVASDNYYAGDPTKAQFSSYSEDGGRHWKLFSSIASGSNPCVLWGGAIAVSARAQGHESDAAGNDILVRLPSGKQDFGNISPAPFFSNDGGRSWTQTRSFDAASDSAFTGQAATVHQGCGSGSRSYTYLPPFWGVWSDDLMQHSLAADPLLPGVFYLNLGTGSLWKSTNGGETWEPMSRSPNLPRLTHHGKLFAEPGVSGSLWLVDGREGATAHGLYHTVDGGITFGRNPAFDYAWALALGKAADGQLHPALYVYGRLRGDPRWGVFQSIDNGVTFNRISFYPAGLFDIVTTLAASMDEFGLVYIGFGGNSFAYAHRTVSSKP